MSMLDPVYRLSEELAARHEDIGRKIEEEKKRPGGPRPEVLQELLDQTLSDHEITGEMLHLLNPILQNDLKFRISMYIGFGLFWIGLIGGSFIGIKCFGSFRGLLYPIVFGLFGHLAMWFIVWRFTKKFRSLGDESLIPIITHATLGSLIWVWVALTYVYIGVCIAILA